ncbi:MAG: phage holin family protein [Demequina sp.]|uniref:phage holin family protein n=1 Tax=Demequina sp. TaxID=2050685 RepID=UPI00198CC324|nr:phage holin family protein [Demequina sp.]MBC7298465.1 phage holin family protein [Demequina sp.]
MRFVIKSAIAAVAVWIVSELPFDVVVTGGENGDWWHRPAVFLVIGVLLVMLNAVLKPLIKVLTLPVQILTLGLFSFVIAWFMLWLTAWITDKLDFATLTVGGFWKTLFAAVVIALVTGILEAIIPGAKKKD